MTSNHSLLSIAIQQQEVSFRDHEGVAMAEEVQKASTPSGDDKLAHIRASKDPYRSTWLDQFQALSRRATYEIIRDPIVTVIKVVTAIVSLNFILHITSPKFQTWKRNINHRYVVLNIYRYVVSNVNMEYQIHRYAVLNIDMKN